MGRIHLFEFEDQKWFPHVIRKGMLEYLSFFLRLGNLYKPSIPLILASLKLCKEKQILDLCSGGSGPIIQLSHNIELLSKAKLDIVLSDKYPNLETYKKISESNPAISYIDYPVDATSTPTHMHCLRTMFSALHHFKPELVSLILKDAAEKKMPLAIFDGGDRNIFTLLANLILHPILFFFCTPFIRPFRIDRYIFTYLLPLIPLCTIWDGMVSILRLYSTEELNAITNNIVIDGYVWKIGKSKHPWGFNMLYLTGSPEERP